MSHSNTTEFTYIVKDPGTGSCVVRRRNDMFATLIYLRGEWHFFASAASVEDARHHYKCARMTLYGEPWEVACTALDRHELPEPEPFVCTEPA